MATYLIKATVTAQVTADDIDEAKALFLDDDVKTSETSIDSCERIDEDLCGVDVSPVGMF